MLISVFSLKHCHAYVQPHRADSIAVALSQLYSMCSKLLKYFIIKYNLSIFYLQKIMDKEIC